MTVCSLIDQKNVPEDIEEEPESNQEKKLPGEGLLSSV